MSAHWQVKVGRNLSKPYTLEQLRIKRDNGTIDDSARCTDDRGESFLAVSELLDSAATLETRPTGSTSPRKLSRPQSGKSRMKRALSAMEPQSNSEPNDDAPILDLPSVGVSTNAELFPEPPLPDPEPVAEDASQEDRQLFEGLSGAYRNVLNSAAAVTLPVDVDAPEDPYRGAPPVDLTPPAPAPSSGTSVRDIAAKALAAEAASKSKTADPDAQDLSKVVPGKSPKHTTDVSAHEEIVEPPGFAFPRVSSLLTMVGGMGAIGLIIWWFGFSGPPSVEDLTGGSFMMSDATSDEPLSLEQLNARTQILGVQLSRVTRALTDRDESEAPIELPDVAFAEPRLPLMPFHREQLSETDASRSEDFRTRYSALVQKQGPDGSKLDEAVIARYAGYLTHLALHAGSEGDTRSESLYRLSEWTKLLFLMHNGELKSDNPSKVAAATDAILTASNDGLAGIFPELHSGDMRFVDVFERCEADEQARLLLVRYWYYRAIDKGHADAWLEQNVSQLDSKLHADIRASIKEVDQFVN